MMTEDEAKTKWCPFAGTPRFTHQSEECIGSGCMAWRVVPDQYERTTTSLGQMPKGEGWRQEDRGDSWGLRWVRFHKAGGGYCGAIAISSTQRGGAAE